MICICAEFQTAAVHEVPLQFKSSIFKINSPLKNSRGFFIR